MPRTPFTPIGFLSGLQPRCPFFSPAVPFRTTLNGGGPRELNRPNFRSNQS